MVSFPFRKQCNIQILLNLRLQEPAVLPALCFLYRDCFCHIKCNLKIRTEEFSERRSLI